MVNRYSMILDMHHGMGDDHMGNKKTSPRICKMAGAALKNKHTSKITKSLAGSLVSQGCKKR